MYFACLEPASYPDRRTNNRELRLLLLLVDRPNPRIKSLFPVAGCVELRNDVVCPLAPAVGFFPFYKDVYTVLTIQERETEEEEEEEEVKSPPSFRDIYVRHTHTHTHADSSSLRKKFLQINPFPSVGHKGSRDFLGMDFSPYR